VSDNNTVAPHGHNRAAHLRVSEGLASLRLDGDVHGPQSPSRCDDFRRSSPAICRTGGRRANAGWL